MSTDKSENTILSEFIKQFSSNINHRQSLFIQFFLGVIIVIVGYSLIYADTTPDALFWEPIRKGNFYNITSHSISSLLGSYIVSQSVLILLGRFIASSGYSYRKLQAVVFSIRKESLGNNFGKYFGKNPESFSPYNKGGTFSSNSYLPEFDVIFFVFIICLQFVLAVSLFFKIGTFEHETFRAIVYPKEFFEIDGHIISLPKLWCFYLINIPVLFTCFFQSVYYYKYIKNVKFEQLEDTPEIKIRNEIRKRYHRKIALTRGYFYFYLIFTLMQFTFLLIRITIDCHYMTTIEHTVTLLIPGFILYLCFLINSIKSYNLLKEYYSSHSQDDILKQMKVELIKNSLLFRKSDWAKSYGIFRLQIILAIVILNLFNIGFFYYSYDLTNLAYISLIFYIITTTVISIRLYFEFNN